MIQSISPAEDEQQANRTYLVGSFTTEERSSAEASLQEMERLCKTAGLLVVGRELVRLRAPKPALYLGTGQADRIIASADDEEARIIVFDQPLTPVQMRNWSRRAQREIYDRHAVILEIFARRARTREAQLQVELARAEYAQSHLAGMWQHLSRQGGGSRLARGEGEKQIEMDRRQLKKRVLTARRALDKVGRQRALRRERREGVRRVALVGYTNAGKSTLLNALANARVRSADQLFATLDPVTRRLTAGPDQSVLLTDTVGFIRNLPPELINAFHSTLEEALEADLLLLVVDAADPEAPLQIKTTQDILQKLGAHLLPRIIVLNKVDTCPDMEQAELLLQPFLNRDDEVLQVSALTGRGIETLRTRILPPAPDAEAEAQPDPVVLDPHQ
ncbi:GTP-binding protein HflX [Alkalispirochaeta americana]|uniref:GTPase HflX n=1 Tax=Alkalispirochaeta americana TaxID=159291 RepID=A0A1N6RBE7_9SPIO|nr:GTPase HflX [Alkalispirochaeta americana]SIQ26147.1 GTP-binding protein HflX [Alkalispirochaeta americana]